MRTASLITARNFIPIYVFWELTRNCNLNCVHCYLAKEEKKELSLREASALVRKLKGMKSLIINFSGGEAMLRGDFYKLAYYTRRQDFAVRLFTNGTLIGRREAKEIKKLSPLSVEISLYSNIPEIHDMITGLDGSWRKTYRAIDYLLKEGVRIRIKCSILKENIQTFKDTLRFIKKMRVPFQFNPVIMPSQDGFRSHINRHSVNEEELAIISRTLSEGLVKGPGEKKRLNDSMCSAGINSLTINAYGDILPCIAFPVKLGNVLQEDIQDVWNKNSFLLEIRGTKNKDLKHCNQCEKIEFCSRCPGIAFLKKGNYRSPYIESCCIANMRMKQSKQK